MPVSRTKYDTETIERVIDEFAKQFPEDVVWIRYEIKDDAFGDPSIFIKVLLTDRLRGGRPLDLHSPIFKVTRAIRFGIWEALADHELVPTFSFRLVSELQKRPDSDWA
jgi:hypothetical protein